MGHRGDDGLAAPAGLVPRRRRPGDLLVDDDGALAAVIDFGTCGVGDPACDLVIAWARFGDDARRVFRDAAGLDDGTWARGRAWAPWKALVVLADRRHRDRDAQHPIIDRVLADA